MALYDRYTVVPNKGESPFWSKTLFKTGQTNFAGTDSLKIWNKKTPEGRPNIWALHMLTIVTTTDANVGDRVPVIQAYDHEANTIWYMGGKAIPASQSNYKTALIPVNYMTDVYAGEDWGGIIPDALIIPNMLWIYLSGGLAGDGYYVRIVLKYQNYRMGIGDEYKEIEVRRTLPFPVKPPEFQFPPARFD